MGCCSSSQTTNGNQYQQNNNQSAGFNATGFSNPLLNNFQNGMLQNINQMTNLANTPVYGKAQIAQNLNGLNSLTNSAINSLKASLARSGATKSGGLSQGITNLLTNRGNQAFNFSSQLPALNRQFQMQGLQSAIGLGNQAQAVAPKSSAYGSTQTGTSTGTNQSTTTQNPSIMSDIGQIAGLAGAFMGMPFMGNFMGGGGGGGDNAIMSMPPQVGPPNVYGQSQYSAPFWAQPQFPGYGGQ